ncbi:MAG: alpha,alpha-trehalose-phosphate synthase (UDP-forming) [Flavobacteriaceae bacterium]
MSRLVIVSNRVADMRRSEQSGGLAVGVADALREKGGVWFGWNGDTGKGEAPPGIDRVGRVDVISTPLSKKDYAEYYVGYSNSVLWPLFHYRLDLVDYRPAYFRGYLRVNEAFARQLVPHLEPDDLVWVHDYHLIPVAGFLRELGCRQRIGYFLHVPFPPHDLLAAAPNHAELVDTLLQYDVIGFQTSTDVANLIHYLEEYRTLETLRDGLFRVGERTVRIDRFPIGIDVGAFRRMAEQPAEDVSFDAMRRQLLGRKQIIGVDRLDYSKGLPQRLTAFGRLLSRHFELEKQVSLLQISPPTREDVGAYPEIRAEMEQLSGSINGRFGDFNWTPIRYIHRSVPRSKLATLLRTSQVGLVTPLRDGMNLVAKEYVAAQKPEDPGVLVLSQFAGAAEELAGALIVNPYDSDAMANALYKALSMSREERRERHAALLDKIERFDARNWRNRFLEALEGMPRDDADEVEEKPRRRATQRG